MLKFINLVKNEFIKLFLKLSTWILIIIVVLMCAGISFMMWYQESNNSYYYDGDYEDSYKSEISYYESSKPDGWEIEAEKFRFLLDNDIKPSDWRHTEVFNIFNLKNNAKLEGTYDKKTEEIVNNILKMLENNDWKTFYQYKIDENKVLYKDDGEALKANNWKYSYALDKNIQPDEIDWRSSLISGISNMKIENLSYRNSAAAEDIARVESNQELITLYEYRLENNIELDIASSGGYTMAGEITMWSIFEVSTQLISTLGILIIIIAGGIVASEFSAGTIKFLLINPVKRWKILTSKYFTLIVFSFGLLLLMYLIFVVMGIILCGTEHINAVALSVADGNVVEISAFWHIAKTYMLGFVSVIVMATLAFMISSLLRNSALAIGVSMFALMSGSLVNMIMVEVLKVDWGRYLIFANTDLIAVSQGQSMYEAHTAGFAVCIIAVHMVLMLLTAWDGFVRREV